MAKQRLDFRQSRSVLQFVISSQPYASCCQLLFNHTAIANGGSTRHGRESMNHWQTLEEDSIQEEQKLGSLSIIPPQLNHHAGLLHATSYQS